MRSARDDEEQKKKSSNELAECNGQGQKEKTKWVAVPVAEEKRWKKTRQ